MNQHTSDLHERVASANPAPPQRAGADTLDAEARAVLERILATPRNHARGGVRPPSRHPLPRASALTATATVLALVAVFIAMTALQRRPEPAYAATPPLLHYQRSVDNAPSARDLLLRLANRAKKQPAPQRARYYYVKTRSWYLSSAVAGGRTCSVVVPEIYQNWIAEDGAGRSITRTGPTHSPSGESGPLCEAAGDESGVDEQTFGATPYRSWPTDELSRDPERLARQLNELQPGEMPKKIEIIEFFQLNLHARAPVPPRLQGALLRVLAGIPDMVNRGQVTDRAGRQGVAVSTSSAFAGLPTDYTLIFDPETGALLGYEETLTEDAGELNVPVPSVLSYTVYLDDGFTADLHRRPTS